MKMRLNKEKEVTEKNKKIESKRSSRLPYLITIAVMLAVIAMMLVQNTSKEFEGREKLGAIQQSFVGSEMMKAVDKVAHSPAYFFVNRTDELKDACIRNSKGEMIMENAGDTGYTVYLGNDEHTAIQFDEKVTVGTDVDLFTQTELALKLLKSGKASIYKYTSDEEVSGYKQYHVVVSGLDNIESMYAQITPEFGEYMREVYSQFTNQFATMGSMTEEDADEGTSESTVSDNEVTEPKDIELDIYLAYSNEDGRFTMVQSMESDGMSVTNYMMDGYLTVSDWALDNWWYDNELTDAEAMAKQLTTEYSKLTELLSKDLGVDAIQSGNTTSNNEVEEEIEE